MIVVVVPPFTQFVVTQVDIVTDAIQVAQLIELFGFQLEGRLPGFRVPAVIGEQ